MKSVPKFRQNKTFCWLILLLTNSSLFGQAYWQLDSLGAVWRLDKDGLIEALTTNPESVYFPVGAGTLEPFRMEQADLLPESLQARYPELRAWKGRNLLKENQQIRLTKGPEGIQFELSGSSHRLALGKNKAGYVLKEPNRGGGRLPCLAEGHQHTLPTLRGIAEADTLVYRLAIAATGEYSNFHGGTIASTLAAIMQVVNRLNAVFERDLAIRFVLAEDNDRLIFLDPETDPYTLGSELVQNQETIDALLGPAAYDLGHVFTLGNGGRAVIGSVCADSTKAMAVSGFERPQGDAFVIDYVAHEIGHQFNAQHTFNGEQGICRRQRVSGSAFEPGSGSTIMSYAGLCGTDNLAMNNSPYFLWHSIEQIRLYARRGPGATCAVLLSGDNQAPRVELDTPSIWLPLSTPFELYGTAFDPEGDPILYNWEQADLGPAVLLGQPSGSAPLFRSQVPSSKGKRIFPDWQALLNGERPEDELLPDRFRPLTFRLSARDQRGQVGSAQHRFQVAQNAGPFFVKNLTSDTIVRAGEVLPIQWAVANTDLLLGADHIAVYLLAEASPDSSILLADQLPNTGSAEIEVPTQVLEGPWRIKIQPPGHAFFAINAGSISIRPDSSTSVHTTFLPDDYLEVFPNPLKGGRLQLKWKDATPWSSIEVFDALGRKLQQHQARGDRMLLNFSNVSTGLIWLRIRDEKGNVLSKKVIQMD